MLNQSNLKDAPYVLNLQSKWAYEDFVKKQSWLFHKAFMSVDSECDVAINNMAEMFNAFIVHAIATH